MTSFDIVSIGLLIAFVVGNWWFPRHFGVVGMILVQISLLVTYFGLAAIAMNLGLYEYDGVLSFIGLAIQAFVINCPLLPIALVALWRRRRIARREAMRGFPVEPLASGPEIPRE